MAEWLSEEWVKEMAALAGSRPSLTGATGTVSVSVSSGSSRSARASGEVSYYWRYEDGVAGGGGIGTPPVADVALVMARSDAWSVLTGEMDPSVAYMRGRLKATGDGQLLLELLKSSTTDGFRTWLQQARQAVDPEPTDS